MKTSKYVFIFSSLLVILPISYAFILMKFFPVLVHQTFYYCQEMAKAIVFNLPNKPGIIVFGIVCVSALYAFFKLSATILRVYRFRQSLTKSSTKTHQLSGVFRALDLKDKVVVLRDAKPFAYCFGVRRPKIYITAGLIDLVDRKELEIILRHEKYHLEHRDNLMLLLARFIESLFPFFPILTDLIRIYKTDRELLADQAAIQNDEDRYALSSILKKLLQYEPISIPTVAPAIADEDTLEARIKSLLFMKVDKQKVETKNIFLSSVFITMLLFLIATPVNAAEFHTRGLDALIVCNENVSCESICKNQKFILPEPGMSSDPKNFSINY